MKKRKELKKLIDKKEKDFFKKINNIIKKHPYFVTIILHEYFRNLFPSDPNLKFKIKDPFRRIVKTVDLLNSLIDNISKIDNYNLKFEKKNNYSDIKEKTGNVYGNLWKLFVKKENFRAKQLIIERFKNFKNFNVKTFFKNKSILDAGCGNGRYSYALSSLGAKKVTAIDFGDMGRGIGKKVFKTKKLTFMKANVLNIPFKKNSFDFVFSNGVLHHTTNFKKGIKELVRVCKTGGKIWLYLYGKGGIYWSSRRRMNSLMKKIPQEYSQKLLDMIGMPTNRFIFMDNWYVPYERHCSHKEVYKILKNLKVSKIEKLNKGRPTDLETGLYNFNNGDIIWGEGEIRLLITK